VNNREAFEKALIEAVEVLEKIATPVAADYKTSRYMEKAKEEQAAYMEEQAVHRPDEEAFYQAMNEHDMIERQFAEEDAKTSLAERVAFPLRKSMNYSEIGRKLMEVQPLSDCGLLDYYKGLHPNRFPPKMKPDVEVYDDPEISSLKYKAVKKEMMSAAKVPESLTDEQIVDLAREEMQKFWNEGNFDTEEQIQFNRELDAAMNEFIVQGDIGSHKEAFVEKLKSLVARWVKKKPTTHYHPITKEKIQIGVSGRGVGRDPSEPYLRKLKSTWTHECEQDLRSVHNLKMERKLTAALASEINAEIDREILSDLKNNSEWENKQADSWHSKELPVYANYMNGDGEWCPMPVYGSEQENLKATKLMTKEEILKAMGQKAFDEGVRQGQAEMQQDKDLHVERLYELGKKTPVVINPANCVSLEAIRIDKLRREAVKKKMNKVKVIHATSPKKVVIKNSAA
jgi:hypothetical protein